MTQFSRLTHHAPSMANAITTVKTKKSDLLYLFLFLRGLVKLIIGQEAKLVKLVLRRCVFFFKFFKHLKIRFLLENFSYLG